MDTAPAESAPARGTKLGPDAASACGNTGEAERKDTAPTEPATPAQTALDLAAREISRELERTRLREQSPEATEAFMAEVDDGAEQLHADPLGSPGSEAAGFIPNLELLNSSPVSGADRPQ